MKVIDLIKELEKYPTNANVVLPYHEEAVCVEYDEQSNEVEIMVHE